MEGVGVTGDGQSCAAVVRQNRGTAQHAVNHRRGVVVHGQRIHGDQHRGGRCVSRCIGGGIGEGVWPRVVGCRCVGECAVRGDGDGAMRRRRVAGDREATANVVAEHGGASQRRVRGGYCRVIDRNRVHR